jgi:hypothetical protein
MMPLALFGSATFIGITVLTLLLYGALGAVTVLIPYLLIEARGYSGIQAGSALLPLAIILAVLSPLMGRLADESAHACRWRSDHLLSQPVSCCCCASAPTQAIGPMSSQESS